MNYLLDTNIILYHFAGEDPVRHFLERHNAYSAVSFITYIEALALPGISEHEETLIRHFFSLVTVIHSDAAIADKAVSIGRTRRIKTPDRIIAATAMVRGLTLVTRNVADFKGIPGIRILDPFAR